MRHHLTLSARSFFLGLFCQLSSSRRTVGVVYSVVLNPLVVQFASQGRTAMMQSEGIRFAGINCICSRRVAED